MKRWQDRGVVEDSEEEELSLELESQSPERPRKRVKHSQEPEPRQNDPIVLISKPTNVSDLENGEVDWIQPKVAKTYSRKARTPRKSTPDPENAESRLPEASYHEPEDSELVQSPPKTDGSTSEQPSFEPATVPSSASEVLPDLNTVFGLSRPDAQRQSMSAASSPLSEREVSPPADFPFLSSISNQAAIEESTAAPDEVDVHDLVNGDLPQATAIIRRNLRARKAIQLNPYQFDRAQYLQQCKARGLKPIRLIEQQQAEDEAGSQSQTASSPLLDRNSPPSSPVTSGRPTQQNDAAPGVFDYFNSRNSSDEETRLHHRLLKRRKLGHHPERSQVVARGSRHTTDSQLDEFSIPPSPPRTSSSSSNVDDAEPLFRQTATGFRIPLGLTPAPLPTPQISSDAKRNDDEDPLSDSPPRRAGPSTARRLGRTLSTISISSSSESESEPESDLEARRLHRERKRIKGVLPASWLKIDLQAQQAKRPQDSSRNRRLSTASPAKEEPLKGVARKISRATQRDHSDDLLDLPGGASDSDGSSVSPKPRPGQARLDLDHERLSIAPSMTVDDDLMENDFIDPMLPGPSRQRKSKGTRVKQPRITGSFRKSSNINRDFSEEQRATRVSGTGARQHRASKVSSRRRQRKHKIRLSIADAVSSSSIDTHQLPQFIRLALRQAKRAPDRGRHSPTHKVIRLATADETEEASSVLRAWREGTITPRRFEDESSVEDGSYQSPNDTTERPPRREPLQDRRQQVFPSPLHQKRVSRPQARLNGQRRLQQTRLQPVALREEQSESHFEESGPAVQTPTVRQKARQPPRPQRLREAQLETLERDFDETHREAMFERRMQCMTENIARPSRQPRSTGFQLDRYLRADSVAPAKGQPPVQSDSTTGATTQTRVPGSLNLPHRPRKPRARRLDVETRQYRQPSEPLSQEPGETETVQADVDIDLAQPVLHGLRPFGTRYPIDFDIKPLDAGFFMHLSTFIGSGELSDALELRTRDLDRETGHVRVSIDGQMFEWGVWNEDVAAQIAGIPSLLSNAFRTFDEADSDFDIAPHLNAVDRNVDYVLRSVVRYLSKYIWFTDPMDRKTCVERLNDTLAALSDALMDQLSSKASLLKIVVRALQYQVVIAKQATLLSNDLAVSLALQNRTEESLLLSSRSLVKHGLTGKFAEVRAIYEETRRAAIREAGIQDETTPFGCIVLLQNALVDSRGTRSLFWQVLSEAWRTTAASLCDVRAFDALWQDFFTILPAMEIDAAGIARVGSRFSAKADDWSLVRTIVSRVLELYEPSSHVRGYSVNEYVRVVLSRCHCLISKWGWWRCEPTLNVVFDFFARRSFNLLSKEESRGSPKFLEGLSSHEIQFEIMPDDCSFHVFLKMLATGILGMRRHDVYADRKIQSIIWRFIPNHNRVYRKDSDMQQKDLEALRNQHDLFTVLYYASPPQGRLKVDLVLGLVDHATSHRDACRLSVRSWANIACYQASTSEPQEALEELTAWFSVMIKTTIAQYRLAKTEAEQDFERAKQEAQQTGGTMVDQEALDITIASNQRQVAAIIVDALAGLKRAMRCASTTPKAQTLVEQTSFWTVFDLFDPSQRRLLSAMQEGLLVCEAALEMQERVSHQPQSDNDDSQDFGDISAVEAFAADDETPGPDRTTIAESLQQPVGQFLSNVFGADAAPEDSLLQQVINIWTRLASVTVRCSAKSWASYVDDYSSTAWSQLRDTAQKHKFTPYFMSQILVQSDEDDEVRESVEMAWLLSLVEREAMLKFQHSLTSALLNCCSNDPLLDNLPFTRDRNSGRYDITLADLRQRRLVLISSVLSNMRKHYDEASRESHSSGQELRSRYGGMLRQLMQAMKANYQDLQTSHGDSVADASVQGGYVDFVQQVVSFLQQYALGICQIDRFFTDSTAFPLPATDPTYVVGRLRSYVPKLSESRGRTQLAVFIQTVSERAATDNQQQYLVNQMAAAMGDVEELGDERAPTLRHGLLTSIFPAYIDKAISSACFWIPAMPILRACELVIENMLYNFQVQDDNAVQAVVDTLTSILHSICLQCDYVLGNSHMLQLSRVLRVLGTMFDVGHSCVTITSFIQGATSLGRELSKRMQTLQEQAIAIEAHVQGHVDAAFFDTPTCGPAPTTPWPDTLSVAEKQVQESMKAKWHAIDNRYYVQRGNRMQEVVAELDDQEVEKTRLLQVIASFCRAFEATFRGPQRHSACDEILGGVLV